MIPTDARINSIVHFADAESAADLAVLNEALLASAKSNAPVSTIVVLPRRRLDQDVRLLFEAIGPIDQGIALTLALTEDYEETWARTLASDRRRQPACSTSVAAWPGSTWDPSTPATSLRRSTSTW